MTRKQRDAQELRIKHAMSSLVRSPDFKAFIDILRENREIAIEDACNDGVIASQRMSMAAIGEVRAYKAIISIYDEYMAQVADGQDAAMD